MFNLSSQQGQAVSCLCMEMFSWGFLETFRNATVTSAGKVASGLEPFVVLEKLTPWIAGGKRAESGLKAEKKQVKSGLEAG